MGSAQLGGGFINEHIRLNVFIDHIDQDDQDMSRGVWLEWRGIIKHIYVVYWCRGGLYGGFG